MELVKFLAGTEHDIEIRDMHDPDVAAAASGYGIDSVPAIVIDGRLSDCRFVLGLDEMILVWEMIFGQRRSPKTRSSRRPRRTRRNRTGKD